MNGTPIGCAGFKEYSQTDAEIKRVWVQPEFRGKHIASDMMSQIENKIKNKGYKRAVLQTREIMTDAIRLYEKCGYLRVDNYPHMIILMEQYVLLNDYNNPAVVSNHVEIVVLMSG